MGISGGEPTLHPDCLRICQESCKRFRTFFYTNLTCKQSLLEELCALDMIWLVNTNTRKELKQNFESNLQYLVNMPYKRYMTFGITLTGNLSEDIGYIENLLRIGRTYPRAISYYRIAFATPFHDKKFRLVNFDKSILYLYKKMDEQKSNIPVIYDCCVNSCQLSKDVMLKVLQDFRTTEFMHRCLPARVDILADRSVNFCASHPASIFSKVKDYRHFVNWIQCEKWIGHIVANYMKKHQYYCKTVKNCKNKNCPGACFALTSSLVEQDKDKPKIITKLQNIRRNINELIN